MSSRNGNRSVARWATCAGFGLLAPVFMNAQLDRSRPPAPGPSPDVRFSEHAALQLPNGMRLIVVEDHKLPMVSVQLRFDIPPILQGVRVGYVEMMGDLLATGTTTRSKVDIDHTVDLLGASFFASNEGVYAGCLTKNIEPLMDLLADVVQNPTFPQVELEKNRLRARSNVHQRSEDPDAIAEAVGRVVTFGTAHPYGEVMTERSIGQIDRAAVEAYYRYFFRPENAYLVFVGDITEKEARELAKKRFGKWEQPKSLISSDEYGRTLVEGIGILAKLEQPSVPAGVRRVYVVDRPGAKQSVIRVSFPLNLLPKDIRAQRSQVMNTILGGGVFNARLMQNLREKRAFTYGAYSSLDVDRFNSSFTVTTSVRTEVTDSAVTEILAEIERLRNEPVTMQELELAKRYMMGSFGRMLEDPKTVARFALNTQLNQLEPDHYHTYLTRLERVTVEHVQEAAQAFLYPDQAAILVVGDLERVAPGIAPFSMEQNAPIIRLNEDGERWAEELTPVTDRTAEQVIEGYIAAVGGREKTAPLRHLRLERKASGIGDTLTVTEWFAPDQYRSQTKRGAAFVEEYIFDGKRVLYTNPEVSGEITDAGYDAIRLQALPVPELAYKELTDRRVLLGSTMLGDKKAFKVMIYTVSGTAFAEYYDVATGFKLRRSQEVLVNGLQYAQITDFSDWKPINGVLFPYKALERGGPTGRVLHEITAVEVAKVMPPTFFEVKIPEVPDVLITPDMLPPDSTVPVGDE